MQLLIDKEGGILYIPILAYDSYTIFSERSFQLYLISMHEQVML